MWNAILWKKVHGQKYPGMWEIAEHEVPSVKMLFKTNTDGHKHPSISLFIIELDTIGETKENKKWHPFDTGTAQSPQTVIQTVMGCSFTTTERHSLYMYIYIYVYIYMSYSQNSYKECAYVHTYRLIYINTEFLDGNKGHQEETNRPTHRFLRLFLDLLLVRCRGCASAMGVIKVPPSCSETHKSITS